MIFPDCFPGSSDSKESVWNAGDPGSVPGSGRSPGEGNSNPLWYFYLENSKDREAWRALVHALQRVRHNWVTNTFMLHIPREIAKIAKLLLLLGFYSIFRNYWYPLTILSRRSFDLPKYMPNISCFFFFLSGMFHSGLFKVKAIAFVTKELSGDFHNIVLSILLLS